MWNVSGFWVMIHTELCNLKSPGQTMKHKVQSWRLNRRWSAGLWDSVVRDRWLLAHTHSGTAWAAPGGHSDRSSANYSALPKAGERRPRNAGWWGCFKKEKGTICPPLKRLWRQAGWLDLDSLSLSCRSSQHGGWRLMPRPRVLLTSSFVTYFTCHYFLITRNSSVDVV